MKTITKDILNVAKFAYKKAGYSRPTLEGVYITDKVIVATNSHTLLEVKRDKAPKSDDFPIIPNQDIKPLRELEAPLLIEANQLLKTLKFKTNKNLPILGTAQLANLNDQTVSLVTTDLESCQNNAYRLIKGEYPNYTKVIPENLDNYTRVVLSVKYLKQMAEAFKDFDDVEIYVEADRTKPVVFIQDNYTGIIMPKNK